MAKPTFLQSLLNKPTQSYTFPAPKKEYHSQKKELVRIAKAFGDARPLQDDNMRSRRSMSPAVTSSSSAGDSAAHFSSMSAAKVEVRHDCTFFRLFWCLSFCGATRIREFRPMYYLWTSFMGPILLKFAKNGALCLIMPMKPPAILAGTGTRTRTRTQILRRIYSTRPTRLLGAP